MTWLVVAATAVVALATVVVVTIRRRLVVVTVVGVSMLPTYQPGDRVIVRRARLRRARPGDVVVIEEPSGDGWTSRRRAAVGAGSWMIKRLVAVPGDPRPAASLPPTTTGPVVPPGAFVVLGDNLPMSSDSRMLGYVPAGRLLGIVTRGIRP